MQTDLKSAATTLLMLTAVAVSAPWSFAAETVTLTDGVDAILEGEYQSSGDKEWILAKGASIRITGSPGISEQRLTAFLNGVQVGCDELGIVFATGVFGLNIEMADGTLFRVPGIITATMMRRDPDPEDALLFCTREVDTSQYDRWVIWSEGHFRLGGKTSVEAVHPQTTERPKLLVSMGGEVDGVWMSSDLKSSAVFEGSNAKFWREANKDLSVKRRVLRETTVDSSRVGASAYRAFIKEAQEGLAKLKKGYDLLQSGKYTDEVLKRMIQSGTQIPRLVLASFNVVYGDAAFSLDPFENWRGQGKVIADVAYLTNEKKEVPEYPPFNFVLEDRSGKLMNDIRLIVEEGDAVVEARRRGSEDWSERSKNQFDLLAELSYAPGEEQSRLTLDIDATGYLLRKAMKVVGQLSIGSMELTKDSFRIHYKPTAPSKTVSSRFSSFLSLREILSFPDRDRIIGEYRPEEIDDATWDFLNGALDHMVASLYRARIEQIDEFEIVFARVGGTTWKLSANAVSPKGKRAKAESEGELPGDPLAKFWEGVEGSKDATGWLDVDFGVVQF